MLENNPDKVKIVYKHFPLQTHRFSAIASLAAVAAFNQGKFWQYHDLIYENYRNLTDHKFTEFAEKLGLNMPQFTKDMNNQEAKTRVTNDMREAREAGVHGTPTLFINGLLIRDRSLPGIQKLIDQELK